MFISDDALIPVCAEIIAKDINETLVYKFVQLAFYIPPDKFC